jgi:hypothetical protein
MIEMNLTQTSAVRPAIDANAPASRASSIFLWRMISSMFMRVNSKCAHQVRPPLQDRMDAD